MNYLTQNKYQILDGMAPFAGQALKLAEYVERRRRKSLLQSGQVKSMAPTSKSGSTPSGKKRRLSDTGDWLFTPQSNRSMQSINPGRRRSVSGRSTNLSKSIKKLTAATNHRTATVKTKGKSKVQRAKKVRVSKQLRQKITQVIKNAPVKAHVEIRETDFLTNDYTQGLQKVGFCGKGFQSCLFNPVIGLYYVARAYMNRQAVGFASTLCGYPASVSLTDTPTFNTKNFQMDVLSNSVQVNLKSNTFRTYYVKFYICTPKTYQNTDNPQSMWAGALANLWSAGINLSSYNNGFDESAPTINKIGQDPRQCPGFNQAFSVQEKVITIQPGEFSMFTVPCFTGKLDMMKTYKNGEYQFVTKYSTYLMYSLHTDLTLMDATDVKSTSRPIDIDKNGICVELHRKFTCAVPEQAGFITTLSAPSIGTAIPLNVRIPKRVYDSYYPLAESNIASQSLDLLLCMGLVPISY